MTNVFLSLHSVNDKSPPHALSLSIQMLSPKGCTQFCKTFYRNTENDRRRKKPQKHADGELFSLPLKYFQEPHVSRVSFGARPPVDHPRDQSQSSMSFASLLMAFYLIVSLIIWLCVVALDLVTLHFYIYVCVWVSECVVSTLEGTHTLDWYWWIIEEFFFTTLLVKGEERARAGK